LVGTRKETLLAPLLGIEPNAKLAYHRQISAFSHHNQPGFW
jgi:hypothetical protein